MKTNNVYLIGYRGVGKSTLAPQLAQALGWPSIELDDLIVQHEGASISDLFARYGEAYFRRCEEDILHRVARRHHQVVSTGGGIVLAESHRQMMRKTGLVVWLRCAVPTLVERLRASSTERPSLTGLSLEEEVAQLVKQREPLYASTAHFTVDTDQQNLEDSVTAILQHVRK